MLYVPEFSHLAADFLVCSTQLDLDAPLSLTPPFTIVVDTEQVVVNAGSGSTFTDFTRGAPVDHTTGAPVVTAITEKEVLASLRGQVLVCGSLEIPNPWHPNTYWKQYWTQNDMYYREEVTTEEDTEAAICGAIRIGSQTSPGAGIIFVTAGVPRWSIDNLNGCLKAGFDSAARTTAPTIGQDGWQVARMWTKTINSYGLPVVAAWSKAWTLVP